MILFYPQVGEGVRAITKKYSNLIIFLRILNFILKFSDLQKIEKMKRLNMVLFYHILHDWGTKNFIVRPWSETNRQLWEQYKPLE